MALFNKNNTTIKSCVLVLLIFVAVLLIPDSVSRYKNSKDGIGNIGIAKFKFTLNNSNNVVQTIDLKDTMIENEYSNDYVVPGTTGDIALALDFSEMEVSTDYVITIGTCDLPNNLKLYTDSSLNNELTGAINGRFSINDSTLITEHIYWKWEFETDSIGNENDNLYKNHNISIPITINASQVIGGGS